MAPPSEERRSLILAKHLRRLHHVPTPTVNVSVSLHGTPASFRPPQPSLDPGSKTLLPLLDINRVEDVQRANALTEVARAAARRRDRRFTVGSASDDHFALRPRAEGRDLKRKSALGKLQSDGTLLKLAALTPEQLAGPRRSRIDSIQYRTRPPKQPTPPLTSTEQLMRASVLHPIAAGLPRKLHRPQISEWDKLALEVRDGVFANGKGHAFPQLMALAQRERHPRSVIAQEALRANPCAHSTNAAEEMSLAGRDVARHARARYEQVRARPGSVGAPHRLRRSVGEVSTQRPFFVRPMLAPRRVHRGEVIVEASVHEHMPFMIDNSCFSRRRTEAEGRAYFDATNIYAKRLATDWGNAITKSRFQMVMAKADDEGVAGLKEELDETREVFSRFFPMLCQLFNYYCALSIETDESLFSMKFNSWTSLVRDLGLASKKSKYCKPADCDNIFVATNFEEDKDGDLADTNDDLALMRFEFLEALTRVSLLKFGKDQGINDVSDSVQALLEEIACNVPDIVRIDANVFRLRLYREDCAAVFDQHLDLLHRLFCFHRAKERKQRLTMPGWLQLCTSVGWIGGDGGGPMSLYDAKVCFLWAQMQVSDEVKHRNKCISLAFVDFLEAIARAAFFYLDPPSEQELAAMREDNETADWDQLNLDVRTADWENHQVYMETPLAQKIEGAMDHIVTACLEHFAASSASKLLTKLDTLTVMAGGTVWKAD